MKFIDKHLNDYLAQRLELVNYATAITGDRSHGEDVVQDAFLRLTTSTTDRTFEEPAGYLRRIVRNLALDSLRRMAFERKHFNTTIPTDMVAEDRPSQEVVLAYREELDVVIEAMAELPERTRIVLQMHRFEGRKLKDIAAQLDISVALAHSLVYAGLDHCRERLAKRA